MFKKSFLSLVLALTSMMSANAQNANECIVDATLNGVPDGTEMVAVLAATHRDEKPLAKGVVKGGKLTLTIPVTGARFIGVGPENGAFTFTLMTKGGEKVQVSLDAKPFKDGVNNGFDTSNLKITSSAMNDEYQAKIGSVKKMLDKMYADYHQHHQAIRDQIAAAWKAKDTLLVKKLKASEEFQSFADEESSFFKTVESSYDKLYTDNKDSWWGPFAMLNTMSYFTKDNKKEWALFSETAKNSFYGQCLNEQINPKSFEGESLPQFRRMALK